MTRLRLIKASALALALGLPTTAMAGGTRTFKISGTEALDRGETDGAAIESTGRVTVGYLPQRGEIKASTAFTCVPDGKSILVGSADDASIFRVFPNLSKRAGKKAPKAKKSDKGKVTPEATLKVKKLAKLDGVVVSAMVRLPGGALIAATLPGGKLVRVSKKGKVSKFATLKAEQVWALTVHKGRLLAATGPKGELYSMSLSGKDIKVVLDVPEKNVLSIATLGDKIIVGTSPTANIYQVSADPEGILLKSFGGADEVRGLAVTKKGLVAAVNRFTDRQLGSLLSLTKTLNRTSLTGQPPAGSLSGESTPSASASLYFVELGASHDLARAAELPWEKWMSRERQYFTDIEPLPGGDTVLVASSASGKIYRVSGPRSIATVADFDERQATSLCRLPKGPTFATVAHAAGVYQLRAAKASQARYRTKVLDATQPATYGAVVLRGKGPLRLRARVGPHSEHDSRWTQWQSIKLAKSPAGLRGDLKALAHRRYLELEVTLGDGSAQLRSLETFYAPENLAPLLKSVDVAPPSFSRSDSKEPKGKMTIKWKVDARDDDDLIYDVSIRPEGSDASQWVKLNPKREPVKSKELSLDLDTVPDGVYEIGVLASDSPTNGHARARTDELVSDPFTIDRQRPTLGSPSVKGRRITASATDRGGYIHDGSFSIDGGSFQTAAAADGLFDSPTETIVIELPSDLDRGKHRIVIRARDSFGNMVTRAVQVTI